MENIMKYEKLVNKVASMYSNYSNCGINLFSFYVLFYNKKRYN